MSAVARPDLGTVIEDAVRGLWRAWRAVMVWCAIMTVLGAVGQMMFRPMMQMGIAFARQDMGAVDGGEAVRLGLIFLLMAMAMLVVLVAAMRSVLRPDAARAAYMRLGADEGRVLLVSLVIAVGSYLAVVLLVVLMAVAASLAATVLGAAGGVIAVVVGIAAVLVMLAGLPWLLVRLLPAVPLTLARGRIVVRGGWRISRGRFWFLFGGMLLTLLMGIALMAPGIVLQGQAMTRAVTAGSDPDAMARMLADMLADRAAMPWGRTIAIILVTGIANGLWLAVQGAMAARLMLAIDRDIGDQESGDQETGVSATTR